MPRRGSGGVRGGGMGLPWESFVVILGFLFVGVGLLPLNWSASSDFVATVEVAGSLAALLCGLVCLSYFLRQEDRFYLLVGLGYFVSGITSLVLGLVAFRPDGATGGMALALMIIMAPILSNRIKRMDSLRNDALIYSGLALLLGAAAAALLLTASPSPLIIAGSSGFRPVDFLTFLFFLAALFLVGRRYRARRDVFSRMLMASVVFSLGGYFFLSFSRELHGSCIELGYVAIALGYLPLLLAVIIDGLQGRSEQKPGASGARIEETPDNPFCTPSLRDHLLESVVEGIVVFDAEWKVIGANGQAGLLMERPDGIPPGLELADLFSRFPDQENVIAAVRTNRQIQGLAFETGESSARTLSLRVVTLPQAGSEVPSRACFIQDITRETEAERVKASFLSSVSHELRNPLTSIKGFTATVMRDPDMAPEVRNRFLGIVVEESTRMADLIKNLREISELSTSIAPRERKPYHLKEVLLKVSVHLEPMAREKSITIKTTIPEGLQKLFGSPDLIQKVFVNIVGNALKFTPENGRVLLDVSDEGAQIAISVIDNGCGIPEEFRPKVFDRFFRLSPPEGTNPGTGLGLCLAKDIVTSHGGRIEVGDAPDGGACFMVFLPAGDAYVASIIPCPPFQQKTK